MRSSDKVKRLVDQVIGSGGGDKESSVVFDVDDTALV